MGAAVLGGSLTARSSRPRAAAELVDAPRAVPDYLARTYTWAYLDARNAWLLDRTWVVNAILWGNYRRLVAAACAEFAAGERVLQAASVYGDLSVRLAERLGPTGSLEVIDVSELQAERVAAKLAGHANASVRVADAAAPGAAGFDAVCCFFLLHEMPDDYKRRVVSALLECVRPGGRVVFVDYARPRWFHPLRAVMALVFRWLEPFAKGLWRTPIRAFAPVTADLEWRERRFFLGLYQLVVAGRRAQPAAKRAPPPA